MQNANTSSSNGVIRRRSTSSPERNLRQRLDEDGERYRERQEKLRHLQKEGFQLANYYFLFQGVIFTSFYSAPQSHLKCDFFWVPLTLSSLAGGLNLCALVGILWSYKRTLDDVDRVAAGNADGGSYSIGVECERKWRILCALVCMLCFVAFFLVTLLGCYKVPCATHTAAPPPPTAA